MALVVACRCDLAGIWGRRWSLAEVRDVLGHSSVTITERYAHLCERVLDTAAAETRGLVPVAPAPPVVAPKPGVRDLVRGVVRWLLARVEKWANAKGG